MILKKRKQPRWKSKFFFLQQKLWKWELILSFLSFWIGMWIQYFCKWNAGVCNTFKFQTKNTLIYCTHSVSLNIVRPLQCHFYKFKQKKAQQNWKNQYMVKTHHNVVIYNIYNHYINAKLKPVNLNFLKKGMEYALEYFFARLKFARYSTIQFDHLVIRLTSCNLQLFASITLYIFSFFSYKRSCRFCTKFVKMPIISSVFNISFWSFNSSMFKFSISNSSITLSSPFIVRLFQTESCFFCVLFKRTKYLNCLIILLFLRV